MLHIDDIKERLNRNPEPQEVKVIREKITTTFANLEFFEEPHKYILHKEDGNDISLPSVSSIVSKFEQKADWETIRKNKAQKLGISDDVLKRQWRESNLLSTSNGSKTHLFGENCMKLWIWGEDSLDDEISHYQYEDGFLVPYGNKEKAITAFYEDILNNDDIYPIMPEAKIYTWNNDVLNLKDNYCGTFDMLFAKRWEDGIIRPFLLDWKTNQSLSNNFARNTHKMMLPPFDDMVDEALGHYTLQLSLYSMGLEQLGYEMTHRIIVWLKEDGTYEKIPVPDVSDKLKEIL